LDEDPFKQIFGFRLNILSSSMESNHILLYGGNLKALVQIADHCTVIVELSLFEEQG
jgi:hypothetical protein